MDKLLRKIYDEVICYEKDVSEMNKKIEKQNINILKKYSSQHEIEEETLLDLIDSATEFAEYEGFCIGMKYAFKCMVKIFED